MSIATSLTTVSGFEWNDSAVNTIGINARSLKGGVSGGKEFCLRKEEGPPDEMKSSAERATSNGMDVHLMLCGPLGGELLMAIIQFLYSRDDD